MPSYIKRRRFAPVVAIFLTSSFVWFSQVSEPIQEPTYNSSVINQIKDTLDLIDQHIKGSEFSEFTAKRNLILLVSSWRSGSTFLSEMIAHHPTVFLHYEPLWHYGVNQIRSGDQSHEAVQHLKELLQCQYTNPSYIEAITNQTEGLMITNIHTWRACVKGPNNLVCPIPAFLERACSKFPTVVAKIVRLRLNLTRSLLEDPDLHRMKIVYLVRDPRATLLSRKSFDWCRSSRDCIDPKLLCDDIDSDLDAMRELSSVYPDRVMLVKYETLAADPLKTFESIFKFSGLSFLPSISGTIRRHTSVNKNGGATTFRKSGERIDRWKRKFATNIINRIQSACSSVLRRLQYSPL